MDLVSAVLVSGNNYYNITKSNDFVVDFWACLYLPKTLCLPSYLKLLQQENGMLVCIA